MSEIKSKKCSKCGKIKLISEFHKMSNSKDGYRTQCKICRKIETQKRYSEKKDTINAKSKIYYSKNKEAIHKQSKIYRSENKEAIKISKKKYAIENSEYLKIKSKEYYENNKDLISHKTKQYRVKNKESIKLSKKRYGIENRESISKKAKKRYSENKDLYSLRAKNYREKNQEKLSDYKKAYYEKNKPELQKKNYKRKKDRLKNDPEFKLLEQLRRRVYNALKAKDAYKNYTSLELLGCSPAFYMKHLESTFTEGMSWDKLGLHGIHVDHIKPCCSFDLSDPEEQKKCFHYTNTQLLWAKDNLKKGGNY